MMNTNINPFSEYGYQPQTGWTGRIMQLNEQGVDTETTVNFGKGFEPENPFLNPKDTFMQEVVNIAATVSDDELKSLFGEMPFGMTRRQALQEQIAAAYSGEGDEKHVDFSKLQAIGNGKKVSTPLFDDVAPAQTINLEINPSMFGDNVTSNSRVYLVLYNWDNGIKIIDNSVRVSEISFIESLTDFFTLDDISVIYGYLTIASDGGDAYRPFGSFSLKTHSNGN